MLACNFQLSTTIRRLNSQSSCFERFIRSINPCKIRSLTCSTFPKGLLLPPKISSEHIMKGTAQYLFINFLLRITHSISSGIQVSSFSSVKSVSHENEKSFPVKTLPRTILNELPKQTSIDSSVSTWTLLKEEVKNRQKLIIVLDDDPTGKETRKIVDEILISL